jgi:ubiquinone/menaquinone biosynthesis C-methylase UbiE
MTTLSWTGERYLPWWKDPVTAYEHWHRYAYAVQFASGKKVLDLASGEGYGSAALAATARQVIALDIDENAVRHARLKYRETNLHFTVGSIMEMPLSKIGFDVIVCFEAIEHISDPEKLLNEVKRLLVPDGLFLVSTPNKPEYKKTEPSNPFHVNELDFGEFQTMLSKHFKRTQFLGQRVYSNSSLWSIDHKLSGMIQEYLLDWNEKGFFLDGADKRVPLYFIGMASDAVALPKATGAVLVDSSNSLLKEASRVQDETAATTRSLEEALAWKESQLQQTQDVFHSQEQALAWKDDQLRQAQTALDWKENQLQLAQDAFHSQEQALAWKDDQLQQAQDAFHSQEQALDWKDDQLQQAQTALDWKENQLQQAQDAFHSQEQALAWKDDQLRQAQNALDWKETQLQQAQATIHSQEQALAWRESQVNENTRQIQILQTENERSAAELSIIKSGRTWRFIQKLLQIRNRLFPPGSRRRALYDRWTGS